MHTKRNFQLKNICFFKSSVINNTTNQIMRHISSDNKKQHEKKNNMCFPSVSDRANSNSTYSNKKISKIALRKNYMKGLSNMYSELKSSEDSLLGSNKKYSNQVSFNKTNIYNESSHQIRNVSNSNISKEFKSYTDLSNEVDKAINSSHSRNNGNSNIINMKNNIRLVLSKQVNNPSSLKSTSASKESNNNTHSIKMHSTNKKHNCRSSNNDVDDINTPEELHYYYIRTLQSGKIAEIKF